MSITLHQFNELPRYGREYVLQLLDEIRGLKADLSAEASNADEYLRQLKLSMHANMRKRKHLKLVTRPQALPGAAVEVLLDARQALLHYNLEEKALADSGDAGRWRAEDQPEYQEAEAAIARIDALLKAQQ